VGYIEQRLISSLWNEIHLSPVVDIRAVNKVRGGARELAKYLGKERLNRYWMSYAWVFRGWVTWSRKFKRALGHYPGKSLLQSLARLNKVKRRLAMDFIELRCGRWEWFAT